jgi:hypothetical protein
MKIDDYLKYIKQKYNPKLFSSVEELRKYQGFSSCSIEDATDEHIKENDTYQIILFDDYRDFGPVATPEDKFFTELYVKYDKDTQEIITYIANGQYCSAYKILDNK